MAIEFAVLAPLLLLVMFGTMRVGLALGAQHALSQIAADAARYALPGDSEGVRRDLVRRYINQSATTYALVDARRMTFDIAEENDALTVTVRLDVSNIPDIPIVSAAYAFPKMQVAGASVAVQR
ncbi:TadE/TadG family type IV pilus assembly protein [Aureimonas sp. AU12]|uniref:TadE/TadG family type IV pilus assembly protein n=1 Tax=Aureimonas sp. AU12 TaxID=1638161 RepID=UPI000782CDF2|nr:TadE/TadG family type IV pilus assembly protein [Aureimonas sp. AU12]